jgi:hypothetical protein
MHSGRVSFSGNKTSLGDKEVSSGNQAILECVEKGLINSLGVSSKAATLYFIELNGGMKLDRISSNPDAFVKVLRVIFGQGSEELLKAIARELRLKEAKQGGDKVLQEFAGVVERAVKSKAAGAV